MKQSCISHSFHKSRYSNVFTSAARHRTLPINMRVDVHIKETMLKLQVWLLIALYYWH